MEAFLAECSRKIRRKYLASRIKFKTEKKSKFAVLASRGQPIFKVWKMRPCRRLKYLRIIEFDIS